MKHHNLKRLLEIWPNFFIVGAPRAGTTSLYEYLKQIPEIYLPRIKEPNYFCINVNSEILLTKPIRDKTKYLELFSGAKNAKAVGDASPTYLWDPDAPKLIHDVSQKARIIIILRNPIERAFSHYLMLVGHGKISSDFRTCIVTSLNSTKHDFSERIIEGGYYFEQVKRYLDTFGKDNVMVFIFEEFFKDTKASVGQVLKFLNINRTPPNSIEQVHNAFTTPRNRIILSILQNEVIRKVGKEIIPISVGEFLLKRVLGKETKKPQMLQSDRELLKQVYFDDVQNLKSIIGSSLPWKEFQT